MKEVKIIITDSDGKTLYGTTHRITDPACKLYKNTEEALLDMLEKAHEKIAQELKKKQ
jgi:hypothetical protein